MIIHGGASAIIHAVIMHAWRGYFGAPPISVVTLEKTNVSTVLIFGKTILKSVLQYGIHFLFTANSSLFEKKKKKVFPCLLTKRTTVLGSVQNKSQFLYKSYLSFILFFFLFQCFRPLFFCFCFYYWGKGVNQTPHIISLTPIRS